MSASTSVPVIDVSPADHTAIIPHCATAPASGARGPAGAVQCPRCHQLVTLPAWARDGDLTECCGLLLRVAREGDAAWLEQL